MFSYRNLLLLTFAAGFAINLIFTIFEFIGLPSFLRKYSFNQPKMEYSEEFDPSYSRLNSVNKLEKYTDSIFNSLGPGEKDSSVYPEILVRVIQRKFYHSYSYYDIGDNYMSSLISPLIYGSGLNAVVSPDAILEKPYAACSQQSNVFMTLLKKKGYKYRSVIFDSGTSKYGRHYTCEIWFNNKWNFFDPDMEPVVEMRDFKSIRPDVKSLVGDSILLQSFYRNWKEDKVKALFKQYQYGVVNAPIAVNATLYHKITRFLSLVMWQLFLLAFQWVRLRKNSFNVRFYQISDFLP